MGIKVVDGSSVHKNFDSILKHFLPHAQKKLGYDKPVSLQLVSDPENAKDPFGKTAYYDPNMMKVTVFVDKRHVKDILRSISHELVHHKQNCEGKLTSPAGEGYAQNNPQLREMEAEAYLQGSGFLLRDWEDQIKEDEDMRKEILDEAMRRTIKRVLLEAGDIGSHVISGEEGAEGPGEAGKIADLKSRISQELGPEEVGKIMGILDDLGITAGLSEETKKDSNDRRPPDTPSDRLRPLEEDESEAVSAVDQDEDGEEMQGGPAVYMQENWSRKPLNERIHKELIKRWCK